MATSKLELSKWQALVYHVSLCQASNNFLISHLRRQWGDRVPNLLDYLSTDEHEFYLQAKQSVSVKIVRF